MKKQSSTFSTVVEATIPVGVSVTFREDSNLNPSAFIVIKASSEQNAAAADNMIRGLLTALLGEL